MTLMILAAIGALTVILLLLELGLVLYMLWWGKYRMPRIVEPDLLRCPRQSP